jgi:hypothetical protein
MPSKEIVNDNHKMSCVYSQRGHEKLRININPPKGALPERDDQAAQATAHSHVMNEHSSKENNEQKW